MKYNYKEGVEKQSSRKWAVFSLFGLFGGVYILVNALSPVLFDMLTPADATARKLVSQQPDDTANKAYIPKINTEIKILSAVDAEALAAGAVQRSDTASNPKDGGNFVLEASKFGLGLTPQETNKKSPFYHLNKLSSGDDIYVDYQGVRYAYKVEDRRVVSESEAMAASDESKLTLYASSGMGREVVTAKPVGKIVWQGGKPLLKSL